MKRRIGEAVGTVLALFVWAAYKLFGRAPDA